MKKFLLLILIFLILSPAVSFSSISFSLADGNAKSIASREALALRVELNRLGNSGDPFEREAILRKIIDICKGSEEAVAAYWDLADLYLDAFPEEMRQEAREMLELCLKNYPASPRASMIKCKLVELYEADDPRRIELVAQIQNDKSLPNILRKN